jgi:TrmH family RNA methyltransferase
MLASVKTTANYCFTEELINEISDRTDKSELMAIFEMKKMTVPPSKMPFIIICDRPSKKGNLGSIIRSADAFGSDGVIVTGHSVDIYDPEVIRASMGSFFAVQTEKLDGNANIQQRITDLKAEYPDLAVVAATEEGEAEIRDYDFAKPLVLLVGNETSGLNCFYLELCDATVKIPMVGEATSFNVASATSIFLYEIFSQRHPSNKK